MMITEGLHFWVFEFSYLIIYHIYTISPIYPLTDSNIKD